MCGSGAFGYGLTHLKEALLVLPIAGFFLISRCTGRAHETSEVTERFDFSLQFIIGAQENFHLKSFISLIYFGLTRPSNGLDRLGNPARASLDIFCFFRKHIPQLEAKAPRLHSRRTHDTQRLKRAYSGVHSVASEFGALSLIPFLSPLLLQRQRHQETLRTWHIQPKSRIGLSKDVCVNAIVRGVNHVRGKVSVVRKAPQQSVRT